jgi:hypothetical protein
MASANDLMTDPIRGGQAFPSKSSRSWSPCVTPEVFVIRVRQERRREQSVAHQELHPRRLRIDHVHSRVKRCRRVKDRRRLWQQGIRALVRDLAVPSIMLGSSFPRGTL